jgi:hypothetical protein
VRAAIVAGDDLHVLVTVAAIQLVLDAQVGELNPTVAVRQVMIERPFRDLPLSPIRPAVAVRSTAVVFLEPLLCTTKSLSRTALRSS